MPRWAPEGAPGAGFVPGSAMLLCPVSLHSADRGMPIAPATGPPTPPTGDGFLEPARYCRRAGRAGRFESNRGYTPAQHAPPTMEWLRGEQRAAAPHETAPELTLPSPAGARGLGRRWAARSARPTSTSAIRAAVLVAASSTWQSYCHTRYARCEPRSTPRSTPRRVRPTPSGSQKLPATRPRARICSHPGSPTPTHNAGAPARQH